MSHLYHVYLNKEFLFKVDAQHEDHVLSIVFGYMQNNGGLEKYMNTEITTVYEGECSNLIEDRLESIWSKLVNENFDCGLIIKNKDYTVIKEKYIDRSWFKFDVMPQSNGDYLVKYIGRKQWVKDAMERKEGIINCEIRLKREGKLLIE